MVRYFPFYSNLVLSELSALYRNGVQFPIRQNQTVVLSLFCSGPLPEGLGLSRFLGQARVIRRLLINSFDLHVNGWSEMRNIVKETLIAPAIPNCDTTINGVEYNLDEPIREGQLQIIESSDFVIYQNCLNEIDADEIDIFETSTQSLLDRMPVGSIFIIIERQGYLLANDLMVRIAGYGLEHNFEMLTGGVTSITYSNSDLKRRILATVCNQLLQSYSEDMDGLVLSPSVRYHSVIIRKTLPE